MAVDIHFFSGYPTFGLGAAMDRGNHSTEYASKM
jgi:hypothetical protein